MTTTIEVEKAYSGGVVVLVKLDGKEAAAVQVEIINAKVNVWFYQPQPDYESKEAVLLKQFPISDLSQSLESEYPDVDEDPNHHQAPDDEPHYWVEL